ncbi:MAG: GGDEF domain-containing protein [Mycobacterium sp.]
MLSWRNQFDDSYYWLTAQLAARGMQRATCRVIASLIIVFGAIPTIFAFSPVVAQDLPHRSAAIGVTVCSVMMGSRWLRRGWPSRTMSQACSVVGAVWIAVACLLASDPMVGLLGVTAFTVLTGYVGLFHSVRLLTVTWLIAGATTIMLVFRLVAINGALAVGSILAVGVLNGCVAFACRFVVRLIRPELVRDDHLEPLTGLPTREGFYDRVSTLLGARNRQDDRHLVIVVASMDSFSLLTSDRGGAAADQARVTLAQCVRDTVRRGALIAHPGDAEFFIADLFTGVDPTPLCGRLQHAVRNASGLTVSIGVVVTPLSPLTTHPPFDVVEELLAIATTAMFEARAAGGDQSRYAINPSLTVLNDAGDPPYP